MFFSVGFLKKLLKVMILFTLNKKNQHLFIYSIYIYLNICFFSGFSETAAKSYDTIYPQQPETTSSQNRRQSVVSVFINRVKARIFCL